MQNLTALRKLATLEAWLLYSVLVLLVQLAWPFWSSFRERPRPGVQGKVNKEEFRYLIYLPRHYEESKGPWPLLCFLHGSGEKGYDVEALRSWGPTKYLQQQDDSSFIVVTPQCPPAKSWEPKYVLAVLDDVIAKYETDAIYLTGYSMGGYGVWRTAAAAPERFKAIAPLCGGGTPSEASMLANLPIRAYHGKKDPVIPINASQEMVNAVNAAGGNAKLTVLPDKGHNIHDQVYQDSSFYDWLLSHR